MSAKKSVCYEWRKTALGNRCLGITFSCLVGGREKQGGIKMPCLPFKKKLFLLYCPIADYLKQHYSWLEQVCWSQQKILLAPPRASRPLFLTPTSVPHGTFQPQILFSQGISLTPTVFRATWGTVRGNFLYKNVIWLGQSRQISALTSTQILPERHSSSRLDLSGVISPWCPFDGYSFLFVVVVGFIVILGKDHNLFHTPSLPTSSFLQLHMLLTWTTSPANIRFLPDQYCVKSPGHKCLVFLWYVCGQCLDRLKQKCGVLDYGL